MSELNDSNSLPLGSHEPLLAHENTKFLESSQGRQVRILSEFLAPDVSFSAEKVFHTIVVFGSARIMPPEEIEKRLSGLDPQKDAQERLRLQRLKATSHYYEECRELSRRLSVWGKGRPEKYALCTGGGPGIMEAGNRGSFDADGLSAGLNIHLPFEQHSNPYITPELNLQFRYFFIRKFWFLFKARCLVAMPGGWGTMDELFEALTLIQTHKTHSIPVLIYGSDFWKKLINWDMLVETAMIDQSDLDLFHFSDNVDEGFQWLVEQMEKRAPEYEGKQVPLGTAFGGMHR